MRRALVALGLACACLSGCRDSSELPRAVPPPLPTPRDVRLVSASLPDWTLTISADDPDTLRGEGPHGAMLFVRHHPARPVLEIIRRWVSSPEFLDEPQPLGDQAGATVRHARALMGDVTVQLAIVEVSRDGSRAVGVMAVPQQQRGDGQDVLQQEAPKLGGLTDETAQLMGGPEIVVINMYVDPAKPQPRQDVTIHVVAYNRGDEKGTETIRIFGFRGPGTATLPGFEPKRITLEPGKQGELTWQFKAIEGNYQFNGDPRSQHMISSVSFDVETPPPGDPGGGTSGVATVGSGTPPGSPGSTPPPGPPVPGPTGPSLPLVPPTPGLRVIALSYPVPVTAGRDVTLSAVVANETPADGTKTVVARVDAAGASGFEWWRTDVVTIPRKEQRLLNYNWKPARVGRYTFTAGEMSCGIDVRD